jgi:hypothetical protein
MIDVGFVVATLVPYVLLYICGENHLRAVWRLSFGLGCVFPIILLFFRAKMVESTRFVKASMVRGPVPYKLIVKRYWKSFLGLSIAWFSKSPAAVGDAGWRLRCAAPPGPVRPQRLTSPWLFSRCDSLRLHRLSLRHLLVHRGRHHHRRRFGPQDCLQVEHHHQRLLRKPILIAPRVGSSL